MTDISWEKGCFMSDGSNMFPPSFTLCSSLDQDLIFERQADEQKCMKPSVAHIEHESLGRHLHPWPPLAFIGT